MLKLTRDVGRFLSNIEENQNTEYPELSECMYSEKDSQVIACTLMKYYENDNAESAMWVLCLQDYSSMLDIAASNEFMDWIVDYMKKNTAAYEGTSDSENMIAYRVGKYVLEISSAYDIYPEFSLSNEENKVWVEPIKYKKCASLVIE